MPYDLFGEWGPENDNGGIEGQEMIRLMCLCVVFEALANGFSEGALYSSRIGGKSWQKNTAEGSVGRLLKIQVRFFCFFWFPIDAVVIE